VTKFLGVIIDDIFHGNSTLIIWSIKLPVHVMRWEI
jgi:hypothetical protein